MNKYSKIKLVNSTHTKKSRSIDFSDLSTFPQIITKPIESKPKTQEPQTNKTHNSPPNIEEQDQENPEQYQETKNGNEGSFNLKLSRNGSVSSNSSSSHRFRFEKQSNPSSSTSTSTTAISLEDAVKRAFSVRRSSSVSERYCRIHDQCVSLSSPLDEDDDEEEQGNNVGVKTTRSMGKKKKKQSKILKACKRFFGL